MGWKPIETAPRVDNLLLADADGDIFVGWLHSAGYWLNYRSERLDENPTHWMPLPEPPAKRPMNLGHSIRVRDPD